MEDAQEGRSLFASQQKATGSLLKKVSSNHCCIFSCEGEGHKVKAEGKSNFPLLSIHSFGGFRLLFAAYFHKAHNYLIESPSSKKEKGFCAPCSSALFPFLRKKQVILTFGLAIADAGRKLDKSSFRKKKNFLIHNFNS